MINITLPDGSIKQYPKGSSAMDVALSISEGLARNVLSAKVNGEIWDASRALNDDATLQLLTWRDADGLSDLYLLSLGGQPGCVRPAVRCT